MARIRPAVVLTSLLLFSMIPLGINSATASEEIPPSGISNCGYELVELDYGYNYQTVRIFWEFEDLDALQTDFNQSNQNYYTYYRAIITDSDGVYKLGRIIIRLLWKLV